MHEIMQKSSPSEFLIEENEEPPSGEEVEEPPSCTGALHLQQASALPFVITPTHSFPVAPSVHLRRGARTTPGTRAFRKRFYPQVKDAQWNDWHWQIANRIRSLGQAEMMLHLSSPERDALVHLGTSLPFGVTPYYMSLLSPDDPQDPLRRSVIPTVYEQMTSPGEADDPLGEDAQSPVPGLVHRYPDRVLFLLSDFCSTYCRYCTRSRVVGHGSLTPTRERLEAAVAYIRQTPTVRDVLLSGGDPLTMGEEKLAWVLKELRSIPHVEILRIGTKVPAVLPQRVTPALVRMLRKYHPLWISVHFTHPDECTPETTRACTLLADAGIPLGSQTVLLEGINDQVDTMRELVHRLLKMRVRPYYLYQCDPISGSAHFRTPVEKGLEIIRGLRGFTSGYAVPTYVIDAPGGGGKVPLMPDYVAGRQGDALILRNYEDRFFSYPDVAGASCPQGLYQ